MIPKQAKVLLKAIKDVDWVDITNEKYKRIKGKEYLEIELVDQHITDSVLRALCDLGNLTMTEMYMFIRDNKFIARYLIWKKD